MPGDRPQLDAMQTGWGDRYRLHETADGWLCVAALDRRARVGVRAPTNGDLTSRTADDWFEDLDEAGIPCEIADPDFVLSFFDDPEMIEKGWVTSYEQALVGRMDVGGLMFDLDGHARSDPGPSDRGGSGHALGAGRPRLRRRARRRADRRGRRHR